MENKDQFFIHETAIVDPGAQVGKGSKIWHWSHISTSAQIGERCSFGQNVFVGNNVKIGGGSGVVKDIEDNQIVMGYPAVPLRDFLKNKK